MSNRIRMAATLTCVALFGVASTSNVGTARATGTLDVEVSIFAEDGGDDSGPIWEILKAVPDATEDGGDDSGPIWEILKAVPDATEDGGDDSGPIWEVLRVYEAPDGSAALVDPSGTTLCQVVGAQLVDVTGQAIFEVQSGKVFVPGSSRPSYSFSGDEVYRGSVTSGALVATTDPEQQSASTVRKLVIAALLADECK